MSFNERVSEQELNDLITHFTETRSPASTNLLLATFSWPNITLEMAKRVIETLSKHGINIDSKLCIKGGESKLDRYREHKHQTPLTMILNRPKRHKLYRTLRVQKILSEETTPIVEALLEAGSNPNQTDETDLDNTPLHIALDTFNALTIELLITKRVDVNATNRKGDTPLMQACSYGDLEITQKLLEAGAKPTLTTSDGMSALYRACRANNVKRIEEYQAIISLLIPKIRTSGAPINPKVQEEYHTFPPAIQTTLAKNGITPKTSPTPSDALTVLTTTMALRAGAGAGAGAGKEPKR